VQVLTVQPTTLTRTLRLTGAVAYNSFRTTPVITQVSGPVSRVVVVPGQKVRRASPCCTWPVPTIRSCAPTT
jgi:cobalt-zinc-cadmium efflux system membrane fusion protein